MKPAPSRPESEKIGVVVIDDSVVIRNFLRSTFEAEADMEFLGSASDGEKGVALVERLDPDLIVLDVEMPVMDGIDALEIIREERPLIRAVVFTSTDGRNAACGMRVLAMPHTRWLTKPTAGDSGAVLDKREQIVSAVRQLMGRAEPPKLVPAAPAPVLRADRPSKRPAEGGPFALLAIGASTGGPDALAELLSGLPGDLPVPAVIVQHMPPQFTQHLAKRLHASSKLTVTQGVPGEIVVPGHVYVAPGGFHLVLEREGVDVKIRTNRGPREHACRPAVDPLFRSAAEVYGSGVLAVVLTGMGHDGTGGCGAVSAAGGRVMVQDEETSVVWGMPGAVQGAGLADEVHPLGDIGLAVTGALCTGSRRALGVSTASGPQE